MILMTSTGSELREIFLEFFKKKGHKIVASTSLIPEDKTVLLTSAGMQQFTNYFSGEKDVLKDFGKRHLVSVQKCFRTPDIDDVGDDTHHTFFEMLGNWSIGEDTEIGYFKEGAVKYALDFLVENLGFNKNKFWITVFGGEKNIPKDEESIKIWEKNGIPRKRIKEFGIKDNLWGPVGNTGPCGPCSEIHYDRGEKYGCGSPNCGPNCKKCERFVELWNLVFMEYYKNENGSYQKLSQRNVDTGIGFERLTAVLQNKNSAYETDLFSSIIKKIEEISGRKYEDNKRIFRIIADHLRGSIFLISDGVEPGNVERGYILRKILRRVFSYGRVLKMPDNFSIPIIKEIVKNYQDVYPEVKSKENDIITIVQKEEEKFEKALRIGIKDTTSEITKTGQLTGAIAFRQHESKGVPLEIAKEIAVAENVKISKNLEKDFEKKFKKHQEVSRAGVDKKFGGVGKEATYTAAKLHTATHLLHQALREILGAHVKQMGSDITAERLRFDFSHPAKITEEEIKKVEEIVNQKIKEDLEIKKTEMSLEEALKSGALAFFKEKYPEKVTVYSIDNFSKEICAGPHAKKTSELGHFKIIKEKSSGAGIRRIRAILE